MSIATLKFSGLLYAIYLAMKVQAMRYPRFRNRLYAR